jgi:hypothetical protein
MRMRLRIDDALLCRSPILHPFPLLANRGVYGVGARCAINSSFSHTDVVGGGNGYRSAEDRAGGGEPVAATGAD